MAWNVPHRGYMRSKLQKKKRVQNGNNLGRQENGHQIIFADRGCFKRKTSLRNYP